MNHTTFRNQIEKQLISYVRFLPIIPIELGIRKHYLVKHNTFKLLDEIQMLKFKIMKFDQMTHQESLNEVIFYTESFESKINY